jgi:hypothetical protein
MTLTISDLTVDWQKLLKCESEIKKTQFKFNFFYPVVYLFVEVDPERTASDGITERYCVEQEDAENCGRKIALKIHSH